MSIVALSFALGPTAIMFFAWKLFIRTRDEEITVVPALLALTVVSANAAFAAYMVIRYSLYPPDPSPPWEDPAMKIALLILSAPVGMVVAVGSGVLGASWRVVSLIVIASLPLLFLGLLVGIND